MTKITELCKIDNQYYLKTRTGNKETTKRVTRKYLLEKYHNKEELIKYPDINSTHILDAARDIFWVNNIDNINIAIVMAYSMKKNPLTTLKKWFKDLPIMVLLHDTKNKYHDSLSSISAGPRHAVFLVIKYGENKIVTRVNNYYTKDGKRYRVDIDKDLEILEEY